MKKVVFVFILIVIIAVIGSSLQTQNTHDEWYNYDGTEIVCRVAGCGKRPMYSKWEDRFCAEHLYKSANKSGQYDKTTARKKVNTTPALTKEQAEKLRGTGYHGTRPNSSAEDAEIKAAMVKCINCGMHTDNGENSLCFECQYNKENGFD